MKTIKNQIKTFRLTVDICNTLKEVSDEIGASEAEFVRYAIVTLSENIKNDEQKKIELKKLFSI